MKVTLRPATRADFHALYGKDPAPRCRAWAGEVDGRLIALGGAMYGVHPQAAVTVFIEGIDEACRYPVALHKAALSTLCALKEAGLRDLALVVDESRPRAKAWAARLGFKPEDDSGVWVCRG
jgi:hypothetical protein